MKAFELSGRCVGVVMDFVDEWGRAVRSPVDGIYIAADEVVLSDSSTRGAQWFVRVDSEVRFAREGCVAGRGASVTAGMVSGREIGQLVAFADRRGVVASGELRQVEVAATGVVWLCVVPTGRVGVEHFAVDPDEPVSVAAMLRHA